MSLEAPVLIIGGGPVGLATALDLGLRGVESIVVERDASTGAELLAKAGTLNERTMEICRKWGIAEAVANCGFPDDVNLDTIYCTGLDGLFIGGDPRPATRDRAPPAGALEMLRKCPQFQFDPILARAALATGRVNIRYGHECQRVDQDFDGVSAQIVDLATGAATTARGRYLVACDGAGSRVRQQYGLVFDGQMLSFSVSAMIRADLSATPMGVRNRYMFIDRTGTWSNLTSVDGRELWRFTLVGTESKLDPAVYDISQDIRRAFGSAVAFEVLRVFPWRRSAFTVERYREGRVFFAGDAAHTTSPTGGHGLNTGVGDALSLGWMLHAVLSGQGGEGLLDAYGAERRPVAVRNSASSTQNFLAWIGAADFSQVMDETPAGEMARAEIGRKMSESLQQEWTSHGVGLGYRYEGSPIIEPDGTPEPPDTVQTYVQTARPGHRAPHAYLTDGRSTIDLFGDGFVLLRFDAEISTAGLTAAARTLGAKLTVVDIAEAEIARLYERKLVLVRPDAHVAWRSDSEPADPLVLMAKVAGFQTARK